MENLMPDVIRLETSALCNFRCVHCPVRNGNHKRKLMTPDAFVKITQRWGPTPRVVVLYHGGEPLLNKNIAYYVTYLKQRGVRKTVLNTNASMLTEEYAEALIAAGLDELKVSFDGNSPEENDQIRRGGIFARDAANVKRYLGLDKKWRTGVIVCNTRICSRQEVDQMILEGRQQIEAPEYLRKYFGRLVEYRSWPARVWPGMKDVYYHEYPHGPGYCPLLFETTTILADGDVVPCCEDLLGEQIFGNIFINDLPEIWANEEYTQFREDFRNRNYPDICQRCYVVKRRYLAKGTTANE